MIVVSVESRTVYSIISMPEGHQFVRYRHVDRMQYRDSRMIAKEQSMDAGPLAETAGAAVRSRSSVLKGVWLSICLTVTTSCAALAAPNVVVFTDRDLGAGVGDAVTRIRSAERAIETDAQAADAACGSLPGNRPRLALLPRVVGAAETAACASAAVAEVIALPVGFQAIALVTPMRAETFAVGTADLFRVFAANAGGEKPSAWNQINRQAPAAPISLLAPPGGSVARNVLNARLEAGCATVASPATLPFDEAGRLAFCSALRTDGIVKTRGTDLAQGSDRAQISDWARQAPAGSVAAISVTELPALARQVVPLLIDGMAPTAAAITAGRYSAARPVTLLIVLPRAAELRQREAARRALFDMLDEDSIGPAGALAASGLVALPPNERVAARAKALGFIE